MKLSHATSGTLVANQKQLPRCLLQAVWTTRLELIKPVVEAISTADSRIPALGDNKQNKNLRLGVSCVWESKGLLGIVSRCKWVHGIGLY